MADTIRHTYIQVRYLAFSLCLLNGIAALLSAGDYFTEAFATFGISDDWQILLLAVIVCAATVGIFTLIAHAWSFGTTLLLPRSLVVAICTLGGILLAISFATTTVMPKTATKILIASAGIALAVGYTTQLILWSRAFSTMQFCGMLAHIGFSSAIAALIALAITSLSSPLMTVIAIVVSPAAAALLIPLGQQESDTSNHVSIDATSVSKEPVIVSESNNASNPLYSLWPVFIGVALCMSLLISMWHSTIGTDEFPLASIIVRGTFLGFILCCLAIGTLAMMCPNDQWLRKVSMWLCPVFAALILIPCIFTIEPKGIAGFALGMCTGIGIAFFMTLPLTLIFLECETQTKNGLHVLGLALLSFAGGGFIGIMLSLFATSEQTTIVSSVLFIAYLAMIALVPREPKSHAKADSNMPDNATLEDPIEIRCGQIAKRCNLTSRETEVFSYLAHGRSATYTAKELYVSTETVKVHIKHIYEKLGVHSRDELLNLVQGK